MCLYGVHIEEDSVDVVVDMDDVAIGGRKKMHRVVDAIESLCDDCRSSS